MKDAILLLAYGGPDSLDDIPAYLTDIRGGRPTSPQLLAEITRRYAAIGGRSPLLEITQRTAVGLAQATNLPVYVGMRHWRPYIRGTVARMAADGIRRCVAICMAPHYSQLSIGAYRAALNVALDTQGIDMAVEFVESWHTLPGYLDGIAANVRETRRRFPLDERSKVKLIFTAHSLPASILERGDPYAAQLHETAFLIARRLDQLEGSWTFAFQSAPQIGVPMLGPQIEDLLPRWAEMGVRNILVAPVGFIAEHVEVLYDIDIGLQEIARAKDVRLERTPMLNDSPALVTALAEIAQRRLDS